MIRHIAIAAAVTAFTAAPAVANEYEESLTALAEDMRAIVSDPLVVAAIKNQNDENANLSADEIEALDQDWRAQVGADSAPLIDAVAGHEASGMLVEQREGSEGLITEIFVMDAAGLNVAMSDTTSDYWQGDEDKYQQTFLVGPEGLHISEVELDESTQTYQAQISFSISDPETGEPIGAATVGVDVSFLE